jgi:PAN domain-containing protein
VVKLTPCNPDTRVFARPPAGNPPPRPVYRRTGQSAGLEYDVNRAGSDYRSFELDAGASACEQACVADGACNAFTWVRPGVQGARARCWLKNRVPGASRDSNCVSGVVR